MLPTGEVYTREGLKIVAIGNGGVGKTSLLTTFATKSFPAELNTYHTPEAGYQVYAFECARQHP